MNAAEKLIERDEVTQRPCHLLAADGDHVVMHPVFHRLFAQGGSRLGDLALVVRELEIHAAAVYVETFAEILHAHGGTFEVPSGEPFAPWRRPSHKMFRRCFFPQRKIERVPLLIRTLKSAAG